MIFVKNSTVGREVNIINFMSKFVKNLVGGRGVNLNLDNVFKYTVCLFWKVPPMITKSKMEMTLIVKLLASSTFFQYTGPFKLINFFS